MSRLIKIYAACKFNYVYLLNEDFFFYEPKMCYMFLSFQCLEIQGPMLLSKFS